MIDKETVLYVGGFQLPDKNAAALRVMANAKALRDIGYEVVFMNALFDYTGKPKKVLYEGFITYEYKRESQKEYLFSSRRIELLIKKISAKVVIAYNYPAVALNRLRKYCRKNGIKSYADSTEWYVPTGNPLFCLIKKVDTELRMRYVQPKMDGVIAISEYLFQYYKDKVKTVKIPPLVDTEEDKWNVEVSDKHIGIRLIYAGSPSAQKEKLDVVVNGVEIASKEGICLDVVGITKEQYNELYDCQYQGYKVTFYGRVPNVQVISMIKEADWVVALREKNKVVQAGFPTKISEAISCGTPIIANRFSNIDEYLDENNAVLLESCDEFADCLEMIKRKKDTCVDTKQFDYRRFLNSFQCFL